VATGTQIATGHNRFLAKTKEAFAPEIAAGTLRIAYERFYSDGAGDAELILEGFGLRLHMLRERSFDRVLIAGTKRPTEWHDLSIVLHVVAGCDAPNLDPYVAEDLSPDHIRTLIQTHVELLASTFHQPWWRWIRTRSRFRTARQHALQAFLKAPKTESRKKLELAAQQALVTPSEELAQALASLEESSRRSER
jgi:hypothetical protein